MAKNDYTQTIQTRYALNLNKKTSSHEFIQSDLDGMVAADAYMHMAQQLGLSTDNTEDAGYDYDM